MPDIILGLHATTHLPSQDLLPAVTPLLTFRALLRHSAAIVRHKTLSALSTLFLPSQVVVAESKRDAFPLSMAKLVKLLGKETEAGPAGTTLRLIRRLIEVGLNSSLEQYTDSRRRRTLCQRRKRGYSSLRLPLRRPREQMRGNSSRWTHLAYSAFWRQIMKRLGEFLPFSLASASD